MKKTILITLCCASLMLITPLTGVAKENTVSNNLPEQPDDVEGLVAQIRVVIDEILQKYGHIPIISSLFNVILNLSITISQIIYCIFLRMSLRLSLILFGICFVLGIFIPGFHEVGAGIWLILLIVVSELDLYCSPYFPSNLNLPIKSIYTLLETNDMTNLSKDCPCLEE